MHHDVGDQTRQEPDPPSASSRRDRFTLSYTAWVLVLFLLFAFSSDLDRIYNLWLALVPILLLPTMILAIYLFGGLLVNLMKRRWRRLASIIASPILAAAPLFLLAHLGLTPAWLRFTLWRGYYEQEITQIPRREGDQLLKAFDWGGTGGAAVANVFYTLVYDESDEIALPRGQRSPEWLTRAVREHVPVSTRSAPEGHIYEVSPENYTFELSRISGHFYLVTEVLPQ